MKPGPTFRKVFGATPEFHAMRDAETWCDERGVAVGINQRGAPRGLMHESCAIAKWRNLRPHERAALDGEMTGDMRHGPVTVELVGSEKDYPLLPPDALATWLGRPLEGA